MAMKIVAERHTPPSYARRALTFVCRRTSATRTCATLTLAATTWAVAAIVLAGCSGDGIGTIFTDPGRYLAFHCPDMVGRWAYLNTREKQLGDLMLKANEGAGGTVIGTLAYRPEYEQILTEKRMLQRAAVEKKCDLVPQANYQSDNIVR